MDSSSEFRFPQCSVVERFAVVEQYLATVEPGAYDDRIFGLGQRPVALFDLVVVIVVANTPVVLEDAFVFDAEDVG